ncbi:uncharacterized protein LOC108212435 [Daucus carota subsp. sativus]|uniref:uncharacterized protein LOC108212435 n=1 Tax=Daucus carota subsp. sativus TaxID=79200 RepID=UPI003082A31D
MAVDKEVGEPIYPDNLKYSQLKFVTKLLHCKNRNKCSDKAFDELLLLLGDVFPDKHKLPLNYNAVKKMVKRLNIRNCKYCKLSRYKATTNAGNNTVPRKVLRHFKITDRLQRLYMSTRTAAHMKYHKNRTVTEGVLTHPADGEEWKEFDKNYPDFSAEIRNVRLGLATDGFPLYRNATSTVSSVWHVVLLVYNLPHTMVTKDPYMFMTLLVPGPNDPGKNLNVYLRPLIDELITLWNVGVETFDASAKTNFMMRAALLWTISDFPGLGMERAFGFGDWHNWTHVTCFFDLPYWDSLRLRHCIDVVHTEKNVFDNIFHTILDSVKTKDTIRSRKDLEAMGIMQELWLNGTRKQKARYSLTRDQLKLLCNWVHRVKLPDGCSSNLKRCCKRSQLNFQGMKSHDCHVFMQKLLPSAFHELLPDDVHKVLFETNGKNIAGIVCTLETIFPPTLFDPMEHLLVHLPEECRLGGPVPERWMYHVERLQGKMKHKVGNKARVEGSIAEKYIYEELTHFCSMYFESEVDTVHNMLGHNMVHDISSMFEAEIRNHTPHVLSDSEMDTMMEDNFAKWFQVKAQHNNKQLQYLLGVPASYVISYKRCWVNGYSFKLGKSSSGILVKGSCYGGSGSNYYGSLLEILKITYGGGNQVFLMKCHWYDHVRGVKKDKNGVLLIDLNSKLKGYDVYILASQATQVYYTPSVKNPNMESEEDEENEIEAGDDHEEDDEEEEEQEEEEDGYDSIEVDSGEEY